MQIVEHSLQYCQKCKHFFTNYHTDTHCPARECEFDAHHMLFSRKDNAICPQCSKCHTKLWNFCEACNQCYAKRHCDDPDCNSDPHHVNYLKYRHEICDQCGKCHVISVYNCLMNVSIMNVSVMNVNIMNLNIMNDYSKILFPDSIVDMIVNYLHSSQKCNMKGIEKYCTDCESLKRYCTKCDACVSHKYQDHCKLCNKYHIEDCRDWICIVNTDQGC